EVREIQHAGMAIGAHSRTHPTLTAPTVDLSSEVAGSRADLERKLGTAPDLFAYPYGDWNARVQAAVRDAGFRAARAFGRPADSAAAADLFALHGTMVTDDMVAFERILGAQSSKAE